MSSPDALRALPKVELHRHLDGSVRFETIAELARAHGLDLGASSEEELRKRTKILAPMEDLASVIAGFDTTQKVLCSYEAIRRVSFENVEDAFNDGVKLVELRFAPSFIAAGKNLTNDEIIEGVLDGVEQAMERYSIEVGLILILPRTFPEEANRKAFEDFLRYTRSSHACAERLCGFDLADSETAFPPEAFLPFVEQAREAGLGITVHSGENTSSEHVIRTVSLFRPDRLGHGIKIWGDPEALRLVQEREIMLEVCPTSNWLTRSVPSLEAHPLPFLHREGVQVSINSDDPHLFGIDLVHEYELCARLFRFTPEDFLAINRRAALASFLPEGIRGGLLERFFKERL